MAFSQPRRSFYIFTVSPCSILTPEMKCGWRSRRHRLAIVDRRRRDYRSSLLQMATCGASVALQIDL